MSTTFSSLPIIDLAPLKSPSGPTRTQLDDLSRQLYNVFATTGFAYLINAPLTFNHADIFNLAREFFSLPEEEKMKLAKKTFRKENENTYRGYFPTQPKGASDNLKEGFEIGSARPIQSPSKITKSSKFNFSEPNVWPPEEIFPYRSRLEKLYEELQELSSSILSLLASALGKPSDFFAPYLRNSISTLRLLHYPPRSLADQKHPNQETLTSTNGGETVQLSCSPHTDSGILTLLHQDSTGGLEVKDSSDKWVPAPYIPESIVVNIGDLMAQVSGGRFVATMHRVRAPVFKTTTNGNGADSAKFGRFSVPFFFEPGEDCVVRSVDDENNSVVYGEHVRAKMKTWVEYDDQP